MKPKVLVTGGTGFVGSHLIDRLIEDQWDTYVLIRKNSNLKWLNKLDVKLIEVDWKNPKNLDKIIEEVDYIIHCAGITKGITQDDYHNGNVIPTVVLLNGANNKSTPLKRFILVSSQAVAGPSPNSTPITEGTPCQPITDYGHSKYQAELEVLKFQNNFPVTILRPCSIYGPRDHEFYPLFQLLKYNFALLIGDGTKQINMLNVKDCVQSIILSATQDHPSGSIYFVTDGKVYDWNSIYKTAEIVYNKKPFILRLPLIVPKILGRINDSISKITKKPALLNSQKIKEMIPDFWLCDSSKISRELGYKSNYSLLQGFHETLDWYQQENWL